MVLALLLEVNGKLLGVYNLKMYLGLLPERQHADMWLGDIAYLNQCFCCTNMLRWVPCTYSLDWIDTFLHA